MRRLAAAACTLALLALTPAPATAQKVVYIAFGDSITSGLGDTANPPGYPPRLERILRNKDDVDAEVINSGVAGETTAEGLSRLGAALAAGGEAVLLMEGTNDVNLINDGVLSVENVIDNLDRMARSAQSRGFRPIHATLLPRNKRARVDRANLITSSVVWAILELAATKNRALVDVWEAYNLAEDPDAFETLFWTDPADPVGHPNADGYDRIAGIFRDVIQEIDSVPPVPGAFEPGPVVTTVKTNQKFSVTLFEHRDSSGIALRDSAMTINGRVVAEPVASSNRRKAVMNFQKRKAIGCKVVLGVRATDRNEPPNTIDRVVAIYDVEGRRVIDGDVDYDCKVNGFDLVSLAVRFGAEEGDDPRYSRIFDINRDGVIDGTDLAILANNFGRSSR